MKAHPTVATDFPHQGIRPSIFPMFPIKIIKEQLWFKPLGTALDLAKLFAITFCSQKGTFHIGWNKVDSSQTKWEVIAKLLFITYLFYDSYLLPTEFTYWTVHHFSYLKRGHQRPGSLQGWTPLRPLRRTYFRKMQLLAQRWLDSFFYYVILYEGFHKWGYPQMDGL